MARRERHGGKVGRIPGRDDEAARKRIAPEFLEHIRNLVDGPPIWRLPRAPLLAVNGPEIAIGVGPFVPDADAILLQVADIGIATQKPEKFVDDGSPVQLLGRDERKPRAKIEPHLMAEDGACSGSGAVGFRLALAEDFAKEIDIGAHTETISAFLAYVEHKPDFIRDRRS